MRILRPFIFIAVGVCLLSWLVYSNVSSDKGGSKKILKKIDFITGDNQCAVPGKDYAEILTIRATDSRDLPYGALKLKIENAAGSDLKFEPSEAVTDAGGNARIKVSSGKKIGDNYLRVIPVDYPQKAIEARFINGVELIGDSREAHSGAVLPLGVRLVDASGAGKAGVKVYVKSTAKGLKIADKEIVTDKNGLAETDLTLPEKSGVNRVDFEIVPADGSSKFRAVSSKVLSFNPLNVLVNVLGGLALFMLGMTMMSDGLSSIAGEKMKGILHFCTSNRFVALLAGAGITAVIQSSSATTVMTIGFVNAGLITLAQSIGVIFGANIGTTITAQIVAFNVSALAMPAIIVGLIMRFIKRGKTPDIGATILGFGLLFFGMSLMGSELKALSDFPSFIEFFKRFDCAPVNGSMPMLNVLGALCVGMIATMIVQSSSATTGVVIVLGAGGLINLYTALALILGANIGTTVTAQLAAIPTNRPARQAALAHTLFNVLGVIIILASFWITSGDSGIPVFFYLVNMITEGNAFAEIPENLPRHIANAHTLFNVATALILLPFTGVLARICEKMLPARKQKVRFQYLEPHLLDSPSLALRQTTFALGKMLKKSCRMIDTAVKNNFITGHVDETKMDKFNAREERVDRYQSEIVEYLAQIMRRKISPRQAEMIPAMMHCANDAERIGDRASNIMDLTRRLETDKLKLSSSAAEELDELYRELSNQMTYAQNALENPSPKWQDMAEESEKKINRLAVESEKSHIRRMKVEKCTPQTGIIYAELLAELVAVSRHLSNIAERAAIQE